MGKIDKQWISQIPIQDIQRVVPMRGGDVNLAFRIETKDRHYFLLVQRNRSADFYTNEIDGLKEFAKAGITAPEVICSGEIEEDAFLVLEFLEEGSGDQRDLGRLVAKMHKHHNENGLFGFDNPYQGSDIAFNNDWTNSWSELFVERRLDHLRNSLMERKLWNQKDDAQYQKVRLIILDTLGRHKSDPSLLHGDLWSGNFMFLSDGRPALFDPAVLYGDREFDLGITTVFGGYSQDFYDAYQEAYPLKDGAWERMEFYRLYFLMVHLNKFGTSYTSMVQRSMDAILDNDYK